MEETKKIIRVALCEGRHEMPAEVEGFIFPHDAEMDPDSLFDDARRWVRKTLPNGQWIDNPDDQAIIPSAVEYPESVLVRGERLIIYVTGFTPALIAIINACRLMGLWDLELRHYNRDTGKYDICQRVWW